METITLSNPNFIAVPHVLSVTQNIIYEVYRVFPNEQKEFILGSALSIEECEEIIQTLEKYPGMNHSSYTVFLANWPKVVQAELDQRRKEDEERQKKNLKETLIFIVNHL